MKCALPSLPLPTAAPALAQESPCPILFCRFASVLLLATRGVVTSGVRPCSPVFFLSLCVCVRVQCRMCVVAACVF